MKATNRDRDVVRGQLAIWDERFKNGTTKIQELWGVEGHAVALVSTYRFTERFDSEGKPIMIGGELFMVCECLNDKEKSGRNCPAQKKVCAYVVREAHKENIESWKSMGLKDAVLDIFRRVKDGEYFGQNTPSMIYVQEAAELLGVEPAVVWSACDELFADEKLDLNGSILITYEKRFRFPIEIQQIIRYMIEEPLGWPNGDAGEGFLYEIEQAIHENTRMKDGKTAFYEHNWPNICPETLFMFSRIWMLSSLASMDLPKKSEEWRVSVAEELEQIAKLLRECSFDTNKADE